MAIQSPRIFNQSQVLSDQLRDQLVLDYLPVVRYLAKQIYKKLPKSICLDDMVSCGVIGLLDAIEKYDPNRKVNFKTYASFRIRGAILDHIRDEDWLPRSVREEIKLLNKAIQELESCLGQEPDPVSLCQRLGWEIKDYYRVMVAKSARIYIRNDDLLNDLSQDLPASSPQPQEKLQSEAVNKILSDALAILPERTRQVLHLYYFEELTLLEISKIFRVSESRACQMLKKANAEIKNVLLKKGIRSYLIEEMS